MDVKGSGTKEDPWVLKTPPGKAEYMVWKDEAAELPALMCKVGGYYGIKKGLRGRFANYVPPVMEMLGLAELEHNARNNRMRAI